MLTECFNGIWNAVEADVAVDVDVDVRHGDFCPPGSMSFCLRGFFFGERGSLAAG